MADGFWGQFGQNLGQGLSTAGEILSPRVYEEVARQRQMQLQNQLAIQRSQREIAAQTLIRGAMTGAIDKEAAQQGLARLGLPGLQVGPSPETQLNLDAIKYIKEHPEAMGGMSPEGGLAPGGGIPAPLAMSGIGKNLMEAQRLNAPKTTVSRTGEIIQTFPNGQYRVLRQPQETQGKAPTIRTFHEGNFEVDKQWDPTNNDWKEVSRSPRQSPVKVDITDPTKALQLSTELRAQRDKNAAPVQQLEMKIANLKSLLKSDSPAADQQINQILADLAQQGRNTNNLLSQNRNFGDLATRITGHITRFFSGRYTSEQRKQIAEIANDMESNVVKPVMGNINSYYTGLAKSSGMNPSFVGTPNFYAVQEKPGQKQVPDTNSKGWPLYRDANGNQAYVGPNGQIEEVK